MFSAAILAHAPAAVLPLKPPLNSNLQNLKKQTFNAEKPPKRRFFDERWSECRDSNPGPPAPKAGALPTAQHPVMKLGDPAGRILPNQARYQLRYTRIFNFCHDTTANGKNKVFSVCGHSCGQSRFCAAFGNQGKSRKRRCRKALRRFALPYPGYNHGTPKASALPTALHPDTVFTLHRKSVFDSPNSILDFGRKVNRPVAYPARIAYNKNITQYIKERAL